MIDSNPSPTVPASGKPSGGRITALALAFELGLLGAAVTLAWLLGRTPLVTFSASAAGSALGLAATVPLIGMLLVLRRSSWQPVVRLRQEVDANLLPLFRDCTWWQFAGIAAAAGLGEEVLFRGLTQGLVTEVGGTTAGVVGASLLFGLAHLITPTYAVLAGLVGLYLGWLAHVTGGLWVPIVAHAAYDFIALASWVRSAAAADPTAADDQ